MDVVVEQGGSVYHRALWIRRYTLHGYVSMPLIITTWTGDIYLRMLQTGSIDTATLQALLGQEVLPDDLKVAVELNPMIHLVWAGVALLSIGVAIPLVKELVKPFRQKEADN